MNVKSFHLYGVLLSSAGVIACEPPRDINKVYPSGVAVRTRCEPIVPEAPTMLVTITDWPMSLLATTERFLPEKSLSPPTA